MSTSMKGRQITILTGSGNRLTGTVVGWYTDEGRRKYEVLNRNGRIWHGFRVAD